MAVPAAPLQVLLVEDNPADAHLVRELLREADAEAVQLTHVNRLQQALSCLAAEGFSAVLLDLSLPDSAGFATFERVHAEAPGATILVLTGLSDQQAAVRAVREGAQDYLVKGTLDGHQLLQALRFAIERRSAAEAVRESEELFRMLIESSFDGIAIQESDRIIEVNQGFAEMFGYPAHELENRTAVDVVAPECREAVARRIRDNDGSKAELVGLRRDGSTFPIETIARSGRRGGRQIRMVAVRDLTEQRSRETALRRNREHLEQVLRASAAMLYTMESRGNGPVMTWISESSERVLGYTAAEVLEPRWLPDHLHTDDAQLHEPGQFRYEFRIRHRDGHWLWLRDERRLEPASDTGQDRIIGVWLDISAAKSLEAQLRQSQRMEAMGALAGSIAHDFNNLLAAITGFADLASSSLPAYSPARDDIEQIRSATQRAAALTRQLLAFSRRQVLQPQLLDARAVVAGIEKILARLIGDQIELEVQTDPEAKAILADSGQIEQVLINLAVNARDAMPAGGRLLIRIGRTHVAQAMRELPAGPYIELAVSDTGIGMDEATKARALEPFFTTKGSAGTGLGLATVYGIATQSGGTVRIDSRPGQGCTIAILLPEHDGKPEQRSAPVETISTGTESILLVEDEHLVRRALGAMLKRIGYTVIQAGDGAEAIAALEQNPVDLVITDLIMPGMDGRDLLARIRERRPGLKSLMISGYSCDALMHGPLDPDQAFIEKPFSIDQLAQKVRRVLDG